MKFGVVILTCLLALTSFFVGESTYGFAIISNGGKPAVWRGNTARYQFYPQTSGYFEGSEDHSGTKSDEFDPIRAGFSAWTSIPGISLNIYEDAGSIDRIPTSGDRINSIAWVRTAWRSLSFRPPSNALAVTLLSFDVATGEIAEADIYFNAQSFRWAVVDHPSEGNYIDVQNIATHEIGHFLGLDHSSEDLFETDDGLADATMYYAASSGETSRRDPHQDDTNGILALYGEANRGVAAISSVELLSDIAGMITLKVRGSGFNEYTSFVITTGPNDYDFVSRYKTIHSSSEADIVFDALGFSGRGSLVVFNQPSNLASLAVSFTGLSTDSATVSASSSDEGGGGCMLRADSHAFDPAALLGFFALLGILFSLRFSQRLVSLNACLVRDGKNKS